jgi:hypothetical protein
MDVSRDNIGQPRSFQIVIDSKLLSRIAQIAEEQWVEDRAGRFD